MMQPMEPDHPFCLRQSDCWDLQVRAETAKATAHERAAVASSLHPSVAAGRHGSFGSDSLHPNLD